MSIAIKSLAKKLLRKNGIRKKLAPCCPIIGWKVTPTLLADGSAWTRWNFVIQLRKNYLPSSPEKKSGKTLFQKLLNTIMIRKTKYLYINIIGSVRCNWSILMACIWYRCSRSKWRLRGRKGKKLIYDGLQVSGKSHRNRLPPCFSWYSTAAYKAPPARVNKMPRPLAGVIVKSKIVTAQSTVNTCLTLARRIDRNQKPQVRN